MNKLTIEQKKELHVLIENDTLLDLLLAAYQKSTHKSPQHYLHWQIVDVFQKTARKILKESKNWKTMSAVRKKIIKELTKNDDAMSEIAISYETIDDKELFGPALLFAFRENFVPKIKSL